MQVQEFDVTPLDVQAMQQGFGSDEPSLQSASQTLLPANPVLVQQGAVHACTIATPLSAANSIKKINRMVFIIIYEYTA